MEPFGQRFVYKNLDGACLLYGLFHLPEDGCLAGEGGGGGVCLCLESINQASGEEKGASDYGLRLGLCMVAI